MFIGFPSTISWVRSDCGNSEILPLTAPERQRSMLPVRAALAGLIALLMLALLAFAQAGVSASTASITGGAGISAARQGDTVALLRTTAKTHAVEVRSGRQLPAKLFGGNAAALAYAVDLPIVGKVLSAGTFAAPASAFAPSWRTNQPRAPPAA